MKSKIPKLAWERSGHLPRMFSWLSREDTKRPTIWARPTEKGWYCQFAGMAYGVSGTGTSRDKAAYELMIEWRKAMAGRPVD